MPTWQHGEQQKYGATVARTAQVFHCKPTLDIIPAEGKIILNTFETFLKLDCKPLLTCNISTICRIAHRRSRRTT
jgi:hypothetical protein